MENCLCHIEANNTCMLYGCCKYDKKSNCPDYTYEPPIKEMEIMK
jgi:hypothetical protein